MENVHKTLAKKFTYGAGTVAQLVEFMPSIRETLVQPQIPHELGVYAPVYNPSIWEIDQEDQKFNTIIDKIVILRPS